MAAHWPAEQVTIFTAVVYFLQEGALQHKSYAVISNEQNHDKNVVFTDNKAILQDISKQTQFTKVHYWSDGAASQFKNKFTLSNLIYHVDDSKSEATWCFHETAHGKGPMDGFGGEIKRAVWRVILQRREVIVNAEQFAKVADSISKTITILYVTAAEVQTEAQVITQRWRLVKPIPGTLNVHFVKPNQGGSLSVSRVTNFSDETHTTLFNHIVLPDLQIENIESQIETSCAIVDTEVVQKKPLIPDLGVCMSDFIVVEYALRKSKRRFLAQVIPCPDGRESHSEIFVQFLSKSETGKGDVFLYQKGDISWISFEQVIQKVNCVLDGRKRVHVLSPLMCRVVKKKLLGFIFLHK